MIPLLHPDPPRAAYSIKETAQRLGGSAEWVRRAVNSGEIRSVRLMGKVLIPAVEIDRILGINTAASSPTPEQMVAAFAQLVGADSDDDRRPGVRGIVS